MLGIYALSYKVKELTGLKPKELNNLLPQLETITDHEKTKYFVPYDMLTERFKVECKSQLVDNEETADDEETAADEAEAKSVENVLGDVSGTSQNYLLKEQLLELKCKHLDASTKRILESLKDDKKNKFNEWTNYIIEGFTSAFAKFKNDLINLKLNEEQVTLLRSSLEFAIQNLNDNFELIKKREFNPVEETLNEQQSTN